MSKLEKFYKFHKQIEEGLSVKELIELRKKIYNVKVEIYSEDWYEKHMLLQCIKEMLDEDKEEVERIRNEKMFTKEEYEFLVNTILDKVEENTFLINSNLYVDKDSDVDLKKLMKANEILRSISFKLDNYVSFLKEE